MAVRVGLLNLWCIGGPRRRARQVDVITQAGIDVLCLLEVNPNEIGAFASACGFSWWRCSAGPGALTRTLAVAVVGNTRAQVSGQQQLRVDDFLQEHDGTPMYAELARWYHQRHLCVDVSLDNEPPIRIGSFHATPGTSRGPGRLGVRGRKPWFHTRIAQWAATWKSPYLFAIDGNTPQVDVCSWDETKFYWPRGRAGESGEELLLGPPGTALHQARDLWREWLATRKGGADLARVPPEGPLARSHRLVGGRWCRYDQIWATGEVEVLDMRYIYDLSCSDHALVIADIQLPRLNPGTFMH